MVVVARLAFQAAVRAAAVELLTTFAVSGDWPLVQPLQVYRGRPRSLLPPSAFVDRLTERDEYPSSVTWRRRTVRAECLVVFGLFDSGEAVDAKDAFADSFLDWVTDRYDAAGASTTIAVVEMVDEPAWTPDWRPANITNGPNPTYYATRVILEGFAGA